MPYRHRYVPIALGGVRLVARRAAGPSPRRTAAAALDPDADHYQLDGHDTCRCRQPGESDGASGCPPPLRWWRESRRTQPVRHCSPPACQTAARAAKGSDPRIPLPRTTVRHRTPLPARGTPVRVGRGSWGPCNPFRNLGCPLFRLEGEARSGDGHPAGATSSGSACAHRGGPRGGQARVSGGRG
jgi:hypothetical protein